MIGRLLTWENIFLLVYALFLLVSCRVRIPYCLTRSSLIGLYLYCFISIAVYSFYYSPLFLSLLNLCTNVILL